MEPRLSLKKIVFYDGKCGVCLREIHFYKSIAPKDKFKWIDVTEQCDLKRFNLKLVDVLKKIHVIDHGKTLIGVDAFIAIWSDLKFFKILAMFISLPGIHFIASIGYGIFAKYRFNRLAHCQILVDKK